MGIVYLATQRALGRPVAVKMLRGEPGSAVAAEKFTAEAQVTWASSTPTSRRSTRKVATSRAAPTSS
jgi:hypothetical protein